MLKIQTTLITNFFCNMMLADNDFILLKCEITLYRNVKAGIPSYFQKAFRIKSTINSWDNGLKSGENLMGGVGQVGEEEEGRWLSKCDLKVQ